MTPRLPDQKHFDHMAERARAYNLTKLLQQGADLLRRNTMPATPDGFGAGGLGGGSSSGTVSDPTFATVAARGRRQDDPVNDAARRYLAALDAYVIACDSMRNAIESVPRQLKEGEQHQCEWHLRAGIPAQFDTTFVNPNNFFDAKRWLCRLCAQYVRDHDQLPTEQQVRHHAQYGKWRIPESVHRASLRRLALGTTYEEAS